MSTTAGPSTIIELRTRGGTSQLTTDSFNTVNTTTTTDSNNPWQSILGGSVGGSVVFGGVVEAPGRVGGTNNAPNLPDSLASFGPQQAGATAGAFQFKWDSLAFWIQAAAAVLALWFLLKGGKR